MKNKNNTIKENNKRFPKFYVLDAVIILLIIAIVLGIYFRYNVFEAFGGIKDKSEAQITFSIKNIKDSTKYYIDIGDDIYFKSSGESLGVIAESTENSDIALITTPASETFVKDGKSITANYPSGTRIDAEGKIKCSGTFAQDGTFMLNGSTYLSAGQTFTVCTEKITVDIVLVKIEQMNN